MPLNQRTTETVTIEEARDRFGELLDHAADRDHRTVIERDGKPVAALISFADLELFDRLLARRQRSFMHLEEISRKFADVPDEEFEREVDKAVAEVRARRRAGRQSEAAVPS